MLNKAQHRLTERSDPSRAKKDLTPIGAQDKKSVVECRKLFGLGKSRKQFMRYATLAEASAHEQD